MCRQQPSGFLRFYIDVGISSPACKPCIPLSPVNTKHFYNICIMSVQRRRRWADVIQMLGKCFMFTGISLSLCGSWWRTHIPLFLDHDDDHIPANALILLQCCRLAHFYRFARFLRFFKCYKSTDGLFILYHFSFFLKNYLYNLANPLSPLHEKNIYYL